MKLLWRVCGAGVSEDLIIMREAVPGPMNLIVIHPGQMADAAMDDKSLDTGFITTIEELEPARPYAIQTWHQFFNSLTQSAGLTWNCRPATIAGGMWFARVRD